MSEIKLKGVWKLVHKDQHGNVIEEETCENLVTNEGFNYILDSSLHAVSDVGTWYFIPFGTFSASVSSTYAGGGGGTELTNYDEATRQEWAEGAASSQSITNATAATITASSSMSIQGIGVAGAATAGNTAVKSDTATSGAVLLAEVASVKTLATAETLDITYTLSKA